MEKFLMETDKRKNQIARNIAVKAQELVALRNVTRTESYIEGFRDGWRCCQMSTEELVALFGEKSLPDYLAQAWQSR
jgi:hypothetical protein